MDDVVHVPRGVVRQPLPPGKKVADKGEPPVSSFVPGRGLPSYLPIKIGRITVGGVELDLGPR